MAAGIAIDYVIARVLKMYRDDGVVAHDLATVGERLMRKILSTSKGKCQLVKVGNEVETPTILPPLASHYYGVDLGREYEERMVARVAECLEKFEFGEVWRELRDLGSECWLPLVCLGESPTPFFTESGVHLWVAHDLAVHSGDRVLVLDWKSGRRAPDSESSAHDQLRVYSKWASRQFGVGVEQVKVQAVWLTESANLELTRFSDKEVSQSLSSLISVAQEAEKHSDAARLAGGRLVTWTTEFPAHASTRRCTWCPWRELCVDGQLACSHI